MGTITVTDSKTHPQILVLILTIQFGFTTFHECGHAVALLVEALRYKPEGCGFNFRWSHWIFLLT
jgi:hypothetical protein